MMFALGSMQTLGVDVIDAKGLLKGAHKVEAVGTGKVYTAKDIILAPGTSTAHP